MEQNKTIENLEQEMQKLRMEIERRKNESVKEGEEQKENREGIIHKSLETHIKENPPQTLGKNYGLSKEEIKRHVKDLEPEEDDRKIEQLLAFALEKGVINAVQVCETLNNPHLLDDFHRRLVHYFNFEAEVGAVNKNLSPVKINCLIIGIGVFIVFIIVFIILLAI